MIRFSRSIYSEKGISYIQETALRRESLSGDGSFTKLCNAWIEKTTGTPKALLTTSCTHALEMSSMLMNIKEGDEVILPSFTFVSTANAFVLNGAKIVFVDIRPDTLNINENLVEGALTEKTKAIVPVHYAGVGCEMDKILEIAKHNNIYVIEDAAQGVNATYKSKHLGAMGDIGCYSFHDSKNYTMGEGGAILVNNNKFIERAEIIREKGTDRSRFFRGLVDKYTWVDKGSSYLPSEINAAYLYAQLEIVDEINDNRMKAWQLYYAGLSDLQKKGIIELPYIPEHCCHNAHTFYIKTDTPTTRSKLIEYLKTAGVLAVFHYIPLHDTDYGKSVSRFYENDIYTTRESLRLLRLPLYYDMNHSDVEYVCEIIHNYFLDLSKHK